MTTKTLLISAGWSATAALAFFAGRSDQTDSAEAFSASTEGAAHSNTEIRSSFRDGEATGSSMIRKTSVPREGREFSKLIQEMTNLDDPIARTRAFLAFVEQLEPGQFQEAVENFRELGMTRERMGDYAILLSAWAKADPYAALAYAKDTTETPFARQTILGTWARDSPDEAIQWAQTNFTGDDDDANPWIEGIIKGLAHSNQDLASKLLTDLPRSRERGRALRTLLASHLNSSGQEGAKNWAQSINDPFLQGSVATRVADELAKGDPEGAMEWSASLGEDTLKRAAPEVIDRWIKEDKNAATAWINRQNDDVRAAAANSYVQNLSLDEADEWLSKNATSGDYDRAIQDLARRAIRGDSPEFGADWIMRITNERQRNRTFHRNLRSWQRKDREGLINYAQNNPVPESILRRLNLDKN